MTGSARAAGRPATLIWIVALLGALAATVLPAASAAAVPAVPAVAAVASPGVQAAVDPGDETVEVTLYYGAECPKCEAEREWLAELAQEYPIVVTEIEVWHDPGNRELFAAAGDELGFQAGSVPTTVIHQRVWIGYTDALLADIGDAVDLATSGEPVPSGVYGSPGTGTCDQDELTCSANETGAEIDVPFVGTVSLDDQSLLMSTVIIGFVDGIYSALTVVGFLGWIQIVVAVAAGIFGLVSVKDYFAFKKGLSFTIPDSAKPGIYKRVREAAGHERLVPALLATVALGVAVSLLETPCTAGFPVLWTGLLQANGVGFAESAALFVAYMIPFLLDEMVVFGIAVFTMKAAKLQEKHGELLKLFAGVTMLALAAVMVIDPTFMESPIKAALLFIAAFLLAWLVHLVTTRIRERRAAAREAAVTP